ncbi:uncharacterized protein LOC133717217 [Rosa rugosa]|uniref:uncharacterized protein LOC133717217 n=1 Tax=Rosa rugosa TaxID=74645 RepID=UPI002B416354|nr:uncharacterized protein LOC133717217 [Rosa rugosa]
MVNMSEVSHQRIKTNGIWMHIAEQGTGPLVLLLHGFPEIWYSWRHQIGYLAKHGYHVVAPDMRGYGDTDSPLSPSSYSLLHLVGDLIDLLDHFGQQQAFVVGHDYGAIVAWHLSLFRPDRVKALVALSAPYFEPSSSIRSIESFRQGFGEGCYVCQFQEPGRAERSFARYDYLTVMKKFLLYNKTDYLVAPPGMELIDYLETPAKLPPWITEEDLQVYAEKFEESGFTGALNYFRTLESYWELMGPWRGKRISVPAKFILGDKDIGYDALGTGEYVKGDVFKSLVPNLEVVILDGHHFIQQEKPQEVSHEILSFISEFSTE